jgi:hypothetical protein
MNKYEIYEKQDITKELLNTIKVGDFIKVNTWKRPMKVIAISENFFIMWKPCFETYMYSICEKNKRGYAHNMFYRPKCGFDSDEFVCGPDNYVFGKYDYDDAEECEEALKDLESGEMEVSQRRGWGIWHLEIKRGK